MKAFATVGSTQFDDLVQLLDTDAVRKTLKELGYTSLTVQFGRGTNHLRTGNAIHGVAVQAYDFKSADLVISHAGAGSIMESLRMRKNLIVVVNEKLMDNHQVELAEEMQKQGHSYSATPDSFVEVLKSADFDTRTALPPASEQVIPTILQQEYLNR